MADTRVENFRLLEALAYAAGGWRVFPLHHPGLNAGPPRCSCGAADCKSVGKHPRTPRGLHDASHDPEALREWWGKWPAANIGVATGEANGIVVLDVDPRHGGDATLAALEAEFGPLPPTVQAVTGGGGAHLFFAHPGQRVPNSTAKVGPGLDVRGDGGLVAVAPSLHASGQRYGWATLCAPGDIDLAPLPGWLLARMTDPVAPITPPPARPHSWPDDRTADTAAHWLGKALMRATEGNRNDTGLWLATQLRDGGINRAEADAAMTEYARRAAGGGTPYTETEALATTRSAFSRPPRERAKATTYAAKVIRATRPPPNPGGLAAELREHFNDIFSGKFYNVPWPWPQLTEMTQALLPGGICVICGDPSVGKTFLLLDCLRFWYGAGYDPVVFFLEKDRKFYGRRLLAQLEKNGRYVDLDWVKDHPDEVRAATARHAEMLGDIGKLVHTAPCERVTLDSLLGWIRQQASAGKRVIVVDPITIVSAGVERWTRDDDFVAACQSILTAHGASLVLVTHPRKGNRPGDASGHDMAAGAAYYRFSDAAIWMQRVKKKKRIYYRTPFGTAVGTFDLFFQLQKTRDGRGAGSQLAFIFGEGLSFAEQGVVTCDADDGHEDGGGI